MIILDILEGVHRIIRVCKHSSTRMHVYMHVYAARAPGTDVFIWGTIGLSKHVGKFPSCLGIRSNNTLSLTRHRREKDLGSPWEHPSTDVLGRAAGGGAVGMVYKCRAVDNLHLDCLNTAQVCTACP